MHITERLALVRERHQHTRHNHCADCDETEQQLEAIQAELAEILARLPAQPDTTPAHITLTAS